MIQNSQESLNKNTPSVDELLNIVQAMRDEMAHQRSELDAQRRELEQLRQITTFSEPGLKSSGNPATTTRRRMLRKLVAGAAGVAALGATVSVTTQDAQAATFDFGNTNASPNVTTITNATTSLPIFKFVNSGTASAGSDPEALPIGVLAKSDRSFAVYGWNTSSSGTAPTGIIGISGNNGVLADGFFNNSNAGVVGTSYNNSGTSGLSQVNSGVEGRSVSSYGVKGISSNGIGGAFGIDSTNVNLGAPLRLGLRNSLTAPTGASLHSAGEISLDKVGRMYVCQAGNTTTTSSISPSFAYPNPGFPDGLINSNGPNWRFMTPMVVKSGPPKVSPTAFNNDTDLHVQGELWLDSSTGKMYVNKQTGSTNATMLTNAGLTNQLPIFVAVGSGTSLHFLSPPKRFIDTRPNGINDVNHPLAHQVVRTYNMTSLVVGGITPIPSGTLGIVGNMTVVSPSTAGYLQIGPSTPGGSDPSTLNFNVGVTCNGFTVPLSGTGNLAVLVSLNDSTKTIHIIIDIAGYYI